MRKRNVKIMLGTIAASGVLGVGIAAAANQPSSTSGNGPQVTNVDTVTPSTGRIQLRARDGTGPRHANAQAQAQAQTGAKHGLRARDGTGPRHEQQAARAGNRSASCPYRS